MPAICVTRVQTNDKPAKGAVAFIPKTATVIGERDPVDGEKVNQVIRVLMAVSCSPEGGSVAVTELSRCLMVQSPRWSERHATFIYSVINWRTQVN